MPGQSHPPVCSGYHRRRPGVALAGGFGLVSSPVVLAASHRGLWPSRDRGGLAYAGPDCSGLIGDQPALPITGWTLPESRSDAHTVVDTDTAYCIAYHNAGTHADIRTGG
jgi:hypothetical protein